MIVMWHLGPSQQPIILLQQLKMAASQSLRIRIAGRVPGPSRACAGLPACSMMPASQKAAAAWTCIFGHWLAKRVQACSTNHVQDGILAQGQ